MMFNRLKKINKTQRGFTLIELIVVIAITGLIIGAITMTIFQLFNISARSDNHMLAVRQVQNAGYWISLDTQMAQSVQPDESEDTGFPLTLDWISWEGDHHHVVYTLISTSLKREHYTNYDPDNPALPDATTFVAEYIDTDNTNCVFTDTDGDDINDTLFLKVTATVSGRHEATETRVYEVIPRPDQ